MEKSIIIMETQQSCIAQQQVPVPFENAQLQYLNQKLQLNLVFFLLNIIMIISIPLLVMFQLFTDSKYLYIKAYLALGLIGFCILVSLMNLIKLKVCFVDFLKSIFILDSITLSIVIVTISFVGLVMFLDRNKWQMKIIEVSFAVFILLYGSNLRTLLLHMKWRPWKVIVYKMALYVMALIFFSIGVYCFYKNYSFTFHLLKSFDKLVKHFVVLFIFAAFQFSCKLVRTMSNFDFTEKLRFDYHIKNSNRKTMSDQRTINNVRKQCIKTARMINIETIKSIKQDDKARQVEFITVKKLNKQQKK